MKYLLVVENEGAEYSAYFPDVSGYAAAGDTLAEVVELAQEGLAFHLEDERDLPASHDLAYHVDAGLVSLVDDSLSFIYVDHEPLVAAH